MTKTVWMESYAVNSMVLNPQKRLGLFGLLSLLQDAAWLHADHLGYGYAQMLADGTLWILTRQKLVMSDWPVWGDVLTVRTWARPAMGARAPRDFEILIGERKIGESTTQWLILDATTRRPVRINPTTHNIKSRQEGLLSLEPAKIPLRDDLEPAATFRVRNSDLDVNGHVGNTRYALWVLDSLSPAELTDNRIAGYDVNFLAETNVGDEIAIARGPVADGAALQFQGTRTADGKTVFAVRLTLTRAVGAGG
jgi:medium-chain acyl-[acyl-carrier-protein] hydrolase